jgi:hypothetical protein
MADTNFHDRKLVVCDALGNTLDVAAIKEAKERRYFGVYDTRKALSDTSGPLVSNHSTRLEADKAAKADHHYKVLETKKPLKKGDHANYKTEVIASNAGLFIK